MADPITMFIVKDEKTGLYYKNRYLDKTPQIFTRLQDAKWILKRWNRGEIRRNDIKKKPSQDWSEWYQSTRVNNIRLRVIRVTLTEGERVA